MQNNVEIIQINISGEDKPGMTSSLTEILARYDAFILDIGQANIHQSLTLGILIKTTADKSGSIMKELLFKASELGVMIRFTPISEERYNDWVGRQGKNRYIITLLGRTVTARHIAEVTKVVAEHGLNIDAIKRLTGRMPLCEDDRAAKSCIELSVRGSLTDQERSTMQEGFMNLSEIGLDVSFQKDDIYRRSRRLICFDMDSTLIETEVIDELAERAGVGDKVREITASAMRGEIDFRESFSQRVALLKGLDVSVMEEIARSLPITEGLERMMTILKRVGYKTAILSGGFTYFGNYLRQKYGFDYVYANELEIEDGRLTGRYVGEVVDGRRKAELLRLLRKGHAAGDDPAFEDIHAADGAHRFLGIEEFQHLRFADDLFFLLQDKLEVVQGDLAAAGKRLGEDGFYGGDGKALEGAHKLLEALLIHIHHDILGDIGDILPQLRQGGQLEFQNADRGGQLLRDLIHRADDEDALLLGLELGGKVFYHAADHIVLQETVEILEDIENGGIGGFFGDEIQHGNGVALAHGHADIKAGGEIPADDPHIFQLGGAVLHYRKEAFLLPGGDIQHGAAGADGQIEFFTEVHIFLLSGKGV